MKIVYSPKYLKYRFGSGHPFWPGRAKQFIELLKSKSKGKSKMDFEIIDAPKASEEDILLVHTKDYLERVKKLVKTNGYLSVDTPVNKDNFEAAYYYVGGTIEASKLALGGQLVVNLLGGLHHAESNNSSGFCIFNDHAIAIRKLQRDPSTRGARSGQIKNACVLDLDVHAGNGTQEIFYSDPTVLKISIHQDPTFFYPGTGFDWQTGEGKGKGFNINIPLPPGTGEKEYLEVLDGVLPEIKKFNPDLLIVIMGFDTYKGDPLASFRLEKETYGKIALRLATGFDRAQPSVLAQARRGKPERIPIVVLFAGGYSKDVPELWYEFIRGVSTVF